MMRVSVGANVYIVDSEDTRATFVDTNKIKTKNNRSHRLGELIRQPQRAKRMTMSPGEKVRKKMKRFQKRNLRKSQHTEQKLLDLLD